MASCTAWCFPKPRPAILGIAATCRWMQASAGSREVRSCCSATRTPNGHSPAAHHFRLGNDLEWSRSVRLIHTIPELPIIAVRDDFSGAQAAVPKILTFNLMAAGPVATPAGPMTPPERTHARESFTPGKVEDELPSAGKVFELPPGVNRLGFIGQIWKAHPAGGIDCDLYLVSDTATQAHIGNWAHLWHPSPEEGQFRGANDAQRFEERQHILRLRGTTAFTTILVPWNKGHQPAGLSVSSDGDALIVRTSHQMLRVNKSTLACDVVRQTSFRE